VREGARVGINVLPHATRKLTELGLLDELNAVGIPTAELAYYSTHGQRIWSEPRGLAAGYRWPQFSIHRGQLLGVLHSAVLERLGPERVHPGHHLSRFGQEADRVWAEFVDRASGAPRSYVEADVLVGSDGIHSVVRQAFFPHEGPPQWNGITLWRAVTESAPFTLFVFEFLDVPVLIRGAATIYQYPMIDRDPLPTWNFGQITLLGAAAHLMYPVGSNGASQAIIDARVLSRELALQPSIEAAIAAYDSQRRLQTAGVVLANRQGGPERCLELVEQHAPDGFVDLDAMSNVRTLTPPIITVRSIISSTPASRRAARVIIPPAPDPPSFSPNPGHHRRLWRVAE
jgi:5-methylphenazine-1-carboxylate 1-monooxygenase